jgi:hypothetical protein
MERFFASGDSAGAAQSYKQSTAGAHRHRRRLSSRKKRRVIRRVITVGVLLIMVATFGLFLRYMSVDHVRPESTDDVNSSSQ